MSDFYFENSNHAHKVDKIIVSLGTNEIKSLRPCPKNSVLKFYNPIIRLVDQIRTLFPRAQIIFQSLLPIRVIYTYTAFSVHSFNEMLLDICGRFNCVFLDCFRLFLNSEGSDINMDLYFDRRIHLNDKKGLPILCRALKNAIYGSVFNPMALNSVKPYYNYNYY